MEWGILVSGMYLFGMGGLFVNCVTMGEDKIVVVSEQLEKPISETMTQKKAA